MDEKNNQNRTGRSAGTKTGNPGNGVSRSASGSGNARPAQSRPASGNGAARPASGNGAARPAQSRPSAGGGNARPAGSGQAAGHQTARPAGERTRSGGNARRPDTSPRRPEIEEDDAREIQEARHRQMREQRRRQKKIRRIRRKIHFWGSKILVVGVVLFIVLNIFNKKTFEFNIPDNDNVEMQYGMDEPETVTATYKGTIFNRKGKTVEVKVEGDTDYSTIGEHTATYTARHGLKKITATRTVVVEDTVGPVITLNTKEGYYTSKEWGYDEEGFTAIDNYDGDVTDSVVSEIDEDAGIVTYTVTDSHGNTSTATRTIEWATKIVYLTYDDGPGKYTQQLLDTLAQYDAKATFFVTNQFPDYIDEIKAEAEGGHCVAIHSYTHDYATVYSSADAFYEDIAKMGAVCEEQTGVTPTIFRFPGGSDNSISRHYCTGVMTDCIAEAPERGYQFVDWNVNSCDAEGVTDPDEIAANIIAGIQRHDVAIVLQHDIKEGSVNAVAQVLEWGKENGYTFLPMCENTHMYNVGIIRN